MKKIISLTLILAFLAVSFQLNSQIAKGGCSDFKNYKAMNDDKTNLKDKNYDDPIIAYGATPEKAKYNAKILVLRDLVKNQTYLDNPRVDSIFAEFAGEMVFLLGDEYDVAKTRPKSDRERLGEYTCFVYKTKYNPDLIDFLGYYINNFVKYSVVFIINPYIEKDGDAPTKELYHKAMDNFHAMCMKPKYKFDNVIELRMLERSKLQPKPANYNPAEGYQSYITGNKYLDFVTSITNNENKSRQVDLVFSMDTISINKTADGKKEVTFHMIGYNTHTATEILVYDSKVTVEATNDYDAVDIAMNGVFERDIDKYMYDIVKRYSSYIRDGMLFSVKIADELVADDMLRMKLERSMLDCKMFAEGSIAPGTWMNKGKQIGKSYEGRTYLLDRMRLNIMMYDIINNAGIKDFNITVSGTDFIVTPK